MTVFGDVLYGKFASVSIRLKTVYFDENALINRTMVYRLIQCLRFAERRNAERAHWCKGHVSPIGATNERKTRERQWRRRYFITEDFNWVVLIIAESRWNRVLASQRYNNPTIHPPWHLYARVKNTTVREWRCSS